MSLCASCNSRFPRSAGLVMDGQIFCSEHCIQSAHVLQFARTISDDVVREHLEMQRSQVCPQCGKLNGPIDLHRWHTISSYLVVTTWKTTPRVLCRSCALQRQLLATGHCLVLGWWGFPWGILGTPIQITRNVVAMVQSGNKQHCSKEFEQSVRIDIARRMLAQQAAQAQQPEFQHHTGPTQHDQFERSTQPQSAATGPEYDLGFSTTQPLSAANGPEYDLGFNTTQQPPASRGPEFDLDIFKPKAD